MPKKPAVSFPPRLVPPTFETTITVGQLMDLQSLDSSQLGRKFITDTLMAQALEEFQSTGETMPPLPPRVDGQVTVLAAIIKHRPETFAIITRDANGLWHAVYTNPGIGTMTNETIKEADIVDWRRYNPQGIIGWEIEQQ